MSARVAWIHVAPIKALRIHEREHVRLAKTGVDEDRRFCIVDENGRWLNAKRVHAFVAVRPEFEDGTLTLNMPDGRAVCGPIELGATVPVSIYGRSVNAREVEGPFTGALSSVGGRIARLVRFDEPGEGVDRAGDGGAVSLLSVASLDAMAEAASADGPVDPRRFRMLFGISGVPAHAEDGWIGRPISIGSAVVIPTGNVGRCAVTTLDPETGESTLDTLAALARYRSAVDTTERLPFGVWGRVEQPGDVAVGDAVRV